jgi:hypothetical protein
VLEANARKLLSGLPDDALVLDVGAGASPFPRADWVLDLMTFEQRGIYNYQQRSDERFSSDTWVVHDICGRDPFPFADDQFDFVICSHTLEDVRDPVWVCAELSRIGKAGYVETPSRIEEQTSGVHGPWVGWAHHHWLVEVEDGELVFAFKSHTLHGRPVNQFPRAFWEHLAPEEKVLALFWEGSVAARERRFACADELDEYLAGFVSAELERRHWVRPAQGRAAVLTQRFERWGQLRRHR